MKAGNKPWQTNFMGMDNVCQMRAIRAGGESHTSSVLDTN